MKMPVAMVAAVAAGWLVVRPRRRSPDRRRAVWGNRWGDPDPQVLEARRDRRSGEGCGTLGAWGVEGGSRV